MEQPKAAPAPDTSRLWDEKETARYLGTSCEFLQADRARGRRIPYVKVGRAVRYDPADVLAYRDRCKVPAKRLGDDSSPGAALESGRDNAAR
jgi:hypothetical protein